MSIIATIKLFFYLLFLVGMLTILIFAAPGLLAVCFFIVGIVFIWEKISETKTGKKINDVGQKIKYGVAKTTELVIRFIIYTVLLIIGFIILSSFLTPIIASIGEGAFIIIVLLAMILHNQEKLLDKN